MIPSFLSPELTSWANHPQRGAPLGRRRNRPSRRAELCRLLEVFHWKDGLPVSSNRQKGRGSRDTSRLFSTTPGNSDPVGVVGKGAVGRQSQRGATPGNQIAGRSSCALWGGPGPCDDGGHEVQSGDGERQVNKGVSAGANVTPCPNDFVSTATDTATTARKTHIATEQITILAKAEITNRGVPGAASLHDRSATESAA